MKPIKREHKISYFDFCNIFPNRTFGTRDKIFKSIYFIQDSDGDYRIEERITFLGLAVLITLMPLFAILCFATSGVIGVVETIKDNKDTFSDRPHRVDECRHNIKSTAQLLELTGWYNLNRINP